MVNAQEYLDQLYPLEERKNIKKLDLINQNLEGDLDLSDFTSLWKINIAGNPRLKEIKNRKEWVIVIYKTYKNAQEWLEKEHPDKEQSNRNWSWQSNSWTRRRINNYKLF